MASSKDNYHKQQNENMAATLKQIAASQTGDNNVYIPPKYRVKDPIAAEPIKDNPTFIPTSRDYGSIPATKYIQVKRFPKSNSFSSSLVGRQYSNSSLNTSITKPSQRSNISLSF